MENQHRKIKNYRELTQAEIDLMNRIKQKGDELLELRNEVLTHLNQQKQAALGVDGELARLLDAEPNRWANIGKTDIQTGVMALVRAVAQPAGV
uniref:Acb2/Tad1 hairpin domain-containing protein n=1 Tax=viral metagenome TaxID=1070528 RepID=A0A6M3J620_9ZZZZ